METSYSMGRTGTIGDHKCSCTIAQRKYRNFIACKSITYIKKNCLHKIVSKYHVIVM